MGKISFRRLLGTLNPYMIKKGILYLRHFGLKEFLVRLQDRTEPEEVPYGPWYENYVPTAEELDSQRKKSAGGRIKISVLVPVFRTRDEYLREMIESVLAQTYENWELCIVNADPSCKSVGEILDSYAAADRRIKVRNLPENRGIAANTNAAFDMAEGDYAALLDHDDLLSPSALYHLWMAAEKNPCADLIYTDEDKVDESGKKHFCPHLKPDFNPDLLRSNNYICHLLCIRTAFLKKCGLFREGFDGAQDHELVLRLARSAERIVHVPEILYHWRSHEGSTAGNPLSKNYALEAGAAAIREDLKARGICGEVMMLKYPGFYRVKCKAPQDASVTIIIPNKDEKDMLEKCITSIREKSTYRSYEILIVENNSKNPETFEYYRQLEKEGTARVITWKGIFNYSAINNFAAKKARGEYLLFLNNDTSVITPDWIEEMLGFCARSDVGIVGARLHYPDDTIQHAGIVMGIGGVAGSVFTGMKAERSGYFHKAELIYDMSAVTAACMMTKASLFEKMGGFEEKLAVAFNDVDYCLRVRDAGYLVVYNSNARLYHYESRTRGPEDTKEKTRRFQQEIEYMRSHHLADLKEGDPFYNKNLSLSKWNYSLRSGARMQ